MVNFDFSEDELLNVAFAEEDNVDDYEYKKGSFEMLFPVIDTDRKDFDYYRNFSDEEYDKMVYDEFVRTNRAIQEYVLNPNFFQKHGTIIDYIATKSSARSRSANEPLKVKMMKMTGEVMDENRYPVDRQFIDFFNGKNALFMMIVDICSDKLDNDVESELRFWKDDSRKLLFDRDIPNSTAIKALPKRHMFFMYEYRLYMMQNCKIAKIYKDNPFKFAVITEKLKTN